MTNLIGVPFEFIGLTYYSTNLDIKVDTPVICKTNHGEYLGFVKKIRKPRENELQKENFSTLFPEIERIATSDDLDKYNKDEGFRKEVVKYTQKQADDLKLDMTVLNCYVDLDDEKILITYQAENRVDFRELVKDLMSHFKTRVELRQLGPRDYASLIGGIGPCGLPLCCSTFLSSFDGISINMAKNQLLAINTSKLSGQCGKLLCCLKFEDEVYTLLKPSYPKIDDKLNYRGSLYTVTSINVLSDTITCYNGENYEYFTRKEYDRALAGIEKKEVKFKDINSNVDLSGKGIEDTNNRIEHIKFSNQKFEQDKNNKFDKKVNQTNPNKNQYNQHNKNNFNNKANKNKNFRNNFNRHPVKKEGGFIPVSEITDRSILDVDKNKDDN